MEVAEETAYRDFVESRASLLLRTAYLLCGDFALAEDLLQNALLGLYRAWPLRDPAAAESYVRRSLCHARTSRWRRGTYREQPVAVLPEPAGHDPMAAVQERDLVLRALATLTPRQRAVVVLRFYDD